MPTTRSRAAKTARPKAREADAPKPTLAEVMKTLEKAGSAATQKTYARHGASEPMFGVRFGTLSDLYKKIGVDHALALQLWKTGNFDARNLAFKLVDPARITPAELDQWARDTTTRMVTGYVSMLAAEGPAGFATTSRWLSSSDERLRTAGWGATAQLAARDEATPDAWFAERLGEIEKTIHDVPDARRAAMNLAVIAIGGRTAALKKSALASAKRIGKVEVDVGDTACETPDAASTIEKTWARAKAAGVESPAAHERQRESGRTRC